MEAWREELYHNELYHYGKPERSGRYRWGSGDRPYQRLGGKGGGLFKRKKKDKSEQVAPAEEKNSRTKAKEAAKQVTKEEALKTMSPTSLHAVRRQLSDEELNRAVSRVKNEQQLEAQSENELRRHTSSSRSAVEAYRNRKEISDAELETLNKRLQEEQKLREFKNAEVERGKKFIKTLDKLDTHINKGLNYYNTYRRVEKVFADIDSRDKARRDAEKAAKQEKREARAQKREERAERRAEKRREQEDRLAREVALNSLGRESEQKANTRGLPQFDTERVSGTVEGEGRSRTSARDKYYYDVDYEAYKPDERTTKYISGSGSTSLAVVNRRRRR